MLSNAYLLAKSRFDTAENERNFAKNWQKIGNDPTDPPTDRSLGLFEGAERLHGVGEGAQGEQNLSGARRWEPLWALAVLATFLATFLSTVAKLKTYSPNFASLKR